MRRRVFLHGSLEEIHQGPIEVVADTIAEAVKRVTLQLKGFRPNAITGRRRIAVVGCHSYEDLFKEGDEDIHLVPQLSGGKLGGLFQVLIGAALIAASFLVPGLPVVVAGMVFNVGMMLLVGGVLQFITAPSTKVKRDHYLGTPQNTTAIGTPIPILYGHRKVGGQLMSLNIQTTAVASS